MLAVDYDKKKRYLEGEYTQGTTKRRVIYIIGESTDKHGLSFSIPVINKKTAYMSTLTEFPRQMNGFNMRHFYEFCIMGNIILCPCNNMEEYQKYSTKIRKSWHESVDFAGIVYVFSRATPYIKRSYSSEEVMAALHRKFYNLLIENIISTGVRAPIIFLGDKMRRDDFALFFAATKASSWVNSDIKFIGFPEKRATESVRIQLKLMVEIEKFTMHDLTGERKIYVARQEPTNLEAAFLGAIHDFNSMEMFSLARKENTEAAQLGKSYRCLTESTSFCYNGMCKFQFNPQKYKVIYFFFRSCQDKQISVSDLGSACCLNINVEKSSLELCGIEFNGSKISKVTSYCKVNKMRHATFISIYLLFAQNDIILTISVHFKDEIYSDVITFDEAAFPLIHARRSPETVDAIRTAYCHLPWGTEEESCTLTAFWVFEHPEASSVIFSTTELLHEEANKIRSYVRFSQKRAATRTIVEDGQLIIKSSNTKNRPPILCVSEVIMTDEDERIRITTPSFATVTEKYQKAPQGRSKIGEITFLQEVKTIPTARPKDRLKFHVIVRGPILPLQRYYSLDYRVNYLTKNSRFGLGLFPKIGEINFGYLFFPCINKGRKSTKFDIKVYSIHSNHVYKFKTKLRETKTDFCASVCVHGDNLIFLVEGGAHDSVIRKHQPVCIFVVENFMQFIVENQGREIWQFGMVIDKKQSETEEIDYPILHATYRCGVDSHYQSCSINRNIFQKSGITITEENINILRTGDLTAATGRIF